jgi:hypothetical protein
LPLLLLFSVFICVHLWIRFAFPSASPAQLP